MAIYNTQGEQNNTPTTEREDHLTEQPNVNESSLTDHRHFQRALQIMEEKRPFLDSHFDLIALSRLACISRTQLSTIINQHTHTSFSNWLAEYRVNYLIGLIDNQWDITIDELYPSAGFATRSTFYRQFRQVTGLTPRQYIKEKGKQALSDKGYLR